MRKNVILFFFAVFLATSAYGQGWQWGRGATGGGTDAWPVATDPSGNVFAACANFSSNPGFYPASTIFGNYTVPYSVTDTGNQTIISKYDANGNFLWARAVEHGNTSPIAITTDKSGNSFLFGNLFSASVQIGSITLTNSIYPETQYFLVAYDPSGNVLWAKNGGNTQGLGTFAYIGTAAILGLGGVATDPTGNVYVSASFHLPSIKIGSYTLTNRDPSGTTDDIFLAEYDPSGNVVWATSTGGNGSDDVFGLTVTPVGDIYISGKFTSPSIVFGTCTISDSSGGIGNAFIARYDGTGTPVWAAGSGGSGNEFAVGVAADGGGNVYLTGGLMDSSISFSGTKITNPYPGNSVLYLAKFDKSNNISWYKTIGDPTGGQAWGYCIAMSSCGAIWVSGTFGAWGGGGFVSGEVMIDGNILSIPDGSTDPVFIAGFSSTGTYAGSAALQSGADDQNGIACDAQGNVYMCADYYQCTPFIVGNDTLADIDTEQAEEWQYLAKYTFVSVSDKDTFSEHSDIDVCPGNVMVLTAPEGYNSYVWSNGTQGPSINVDSLGTYWVIGEGKCTIIDTITIVPAELCCKPVLPNAFSPNWDGKNDTYYPIFEQGCHIAGYGFSIFNRWGERVFYSEDPTAQWDGKFQGVNAEMGTYMYQLKYNIGANNKPQLMKGDVTLIR